MTFGHITPLDPVSSNADGSNDIIALSQYDQNMCNMTFWTCNTIGTSTGIM